MGRINIMFKQILPNVMTPIIVSTTTNVAVYILQEATLSFIGLGISDQTPTWGNILNAAKSCICSDKSVVDMDISGISNYVICTCYQFSGRWYPRCHGCKTAVREEFHG